MHARRALIAALALASVTASSSAQERARPDPFATIETADPIELARAVDRLGDRAVLSRLEDRRPRAVRLAAVRAAPHMREPELALERLARLAAGRDPLLAPAAASAALRIVRALDPDELARREVDLASLAPAHALLAALAADESARPDLQIAATIARARLEGLGVAARH